MEQRICEKCGNGCEMCYKRGYEDMILAFEHVLDKAVDESGKTARMDTMQKFAVKKMLQGMLISLRASIKAGIGR